MKKFTIHDGTFYITNVCNLTCDQCYSFNNRNFKGHYDWSQSKELYNEWSKILTIKDACILGGEPFAHPKLFEWASNLRFLWPEIENFNIATNGTYLKNNIELCRSLIDMGFWIDICVHDPSQYEEIKDVFLEIIKGYSYDVYNDNEYVVNGKKIAKLQKYYIFANNAQRMIRKGVTYLYDSDAEKAHSICQAKECHYFVDGKLHKCFLVGVGKELTKQFPFDPKSTALLNEYQGISPFDKDVEYRLENIKNCISQCSLCPESYTTAKITLFPKKLKL